MYKKCLVLTEVLQIYLGKFSSRPVPAEEIPPQIVVIVRESHPKCPQNSGGKEFRSLYSYILYIVIRP